MKRRGSLGYFKSRGVVASAVTATVAGTANTVAKFTSANNIGNSSITDNGTNISTSEGIIFTGNSPPAASNNYIAVNAGGSTIINSPSTKNLILAINAAATFGMTATSVYSIFGITTAALGVPITLGSTFEKSESGADANVLTYTPGAADEQLSIDIAFDINAMVVGVGSVGVQIAYTDSNNVAVAATSLSMSKIGAALPVAAIITVGNYYDSVQITARTAVNVIVSIVSSVTSYTGKISVTVKRQV